jgi:hypothetical protein
MNDIIEIESFLDPADVEEINNFLTSSNFAWYYNPGISGLINNEEDFKNDPNIKDVDGFVHQFVHSSKVESPHAQIVNIILRALETKGIIKVTDVLRARAVLVYKDPSFGDYYQLPHVDWTEQHYTVLYYVNDTDGDTIFFEEMYKEDDHSKKTIEKRIAPKKGKCVIFNGLKYHTGSVPSNNNRIAISINYI